MLSQEAAALKAEMRQRGKTLCLSDQSMPVHEVSGHSQTRYHAWYRRQRQHEGCVGGARRQIPARQHYLKPSGRIERFLSFQASISDS
jgi:hypothetical protein